MNRSHVIFDFDGTLSDSLPGITETLNICLAEFSFPSVSADIVRSFVGNGIPALVSKSIAHFRGATAGPFSGESELLARYYEVYREHCLNGTSLYHGVEDLLNDLSRLTLVLISNKTEAMTRYMLEAYGISRHFSLILGGDSMPVRKPDPLLFRHAAELTGSQDPSEWVMIGDSCVDMIFAANSGISAIACTWGYEDAKALTQCHKGPRADSISELSLILNIDD